MTAIFSDDATHLLQECRLIGGMHQRLVAVTEGLERAIESLELLLCALAVGDVGEIDAHPPQFRAIVNCLQESPAIGLNFADNFLFGIGCEFGDRRCYFGE